MKKEKVIPQNFGMSFFVEVDKQSGGKFHNPAIRLLEEMANRKDIQVLDSFNFGLMVGYATALRFGLQLQAAGEDVTYLSSAMPFFKAPKEEKSRIDTLLEKIINAGDGKGTVSDDEMEEAASLLVLNWPKNRGAVAEMAQKFRAGIKKNEVDRTIQAKEKAEAAAAAKKAA